MENNEYFKKAYRIYKQFRFKMFIDAVFFTTCPGFGIVTKIIKDLIV